MAYREVQADLRQAASSRALVAASQVGGLFGQSSQQRLLDIRHVAADPALLRFLEQPNEATRQAARDRLGQFSNTGSQVIDVWNDAGMRLLTVATPARADALLPGGGPPSASGISPLRKAGAAVYSEASVEIQPDASADDRSTNTPRGWLVVRRLATAAPTAEVLNRLVGADARIAVGNRNGGVWTDLVSPTNPPRINLAQFGAAQETASDGVRYVGALAAIRGTPWSIWIAFPDASVLAPARAFLQRMLLIAVAFLVLSTTIVAFVERAHHITALHADGRVRGDCRRGVLPARAGESTGRNRPSERGLQCDDGEG